ncbi:MAG: hypothetical protein MN733_34785, partial [Nitrososphaera sp.]|nr:hypothetical protein [Nitrososphaera sp.]
ARGSPVFPNEVTMARVWNSDYDITFTNEDTMTRYKKLAEIAHLVSIKKNKSRVNIMVDGGIRVEAQVTNNGVRLMECVAEIPFKRSII